MDKKGIISQVLKKNYLISPDIFDSNLKNEEIISFLEKNFENSEQLLVINKDVLEFSSEINSVNWPEFEKSRVLMEKGREQEPYFKIIKKDKKEDQAVSIQEIKSNVKILTKYVKQDKKIILQDFTEYFKVRYKALKEILLNRQELLDSTSISKVLSKKDRGKVSIIGMVMNKNITKNDNFIFEIEDSTGLIKVIIGKKDLDLYNTAKEVMLDETLGIVGSFSNGVLFGQRIIFPDVPLTKELKKCPDDTYMICTSDIHVGSRLFHRDAFLNFISWLNGEIGDEKQIEISKKIKYLIITGDLVAGVGVYPNQDKDLTLIDINDQYKELANLLGKIRKDIQIILCAGDHDAVMVNEPQPILDKEFAKEIFSLENVHLVNNPSFVNIHASENFDGFNCLLYHGHSFIYYADNIESIRSSGWTARGDLIMKYLLQRRHLSPTHTATVYLPDSKADPLVIDPVPDFFISGHLHQVSNLIYRNVSLVGCGCWEALTPYQEKTGNKADPAKVTLINLKTREVKILNFLKDELI